jgi:ribosomal protein L16/L10AE
MSEERSELGERADEIFERKIRPQVDVEEEAHKYVAIDVESEDFEVDANQLAAADRLIERHPEAEGRIWFRRVGSRFAHHFGGWPRKEDAK